MSAAALIQQFEDHGAHFELRPDGVHLVRPKGSVLPPELIEAARARKSEIGNALARATPDRQISAAAQFDDADHAERAAIMEADAGMPREWRQYIRGDLATCRPG
jgi:hypothetical protein